MAHGPHAARERAGTIQAEVEDADPLFKRYLKEHEIFQKDLLINLLTKNIECADDISTITLPEFQDIKRRTERAVRADGKSMKPVQNMLKKFEKLWRKEASVPRSQMDWDGMPRTPKSDREPTIIPGGGGVAVTSPRAGRRSPQPSPSASPRNSGDEFSFPDTGSPGRTASKRRGRMGGSGALNRSRGGSPAPPRSPRSRKAVNRSGVGTTSQNEANALRRAVANSNATTEEKTNSSRPVNRSRRAQTLLPTPAKMKRSASSRGIGDGKAHGRNRSLQPSERGKEQKGGRNAKKGNKRKNRRTRDAEDRVELEELKWTCANGHENLTSHMFCPSCGQSQEQAMARKEDHWDEPEHIAFILNSDVGRNFSLDAHLLELQMHHLANTCIPKTRWHQGSYDGRLSLLFCVDASVTRRALFRVTEQFNKLMEVEPHGSWLHTFGYISLTNATEENRQAIKRLSLIDTDALARLRSGTATQREENPEFFGILCKPIEFPHEQTPILLSELTRGDQKTPMEFPEKVALIDKIVDAVLYLHENDVSHGFLTTDIMWVDPTLQNLKIFPLVPIDEFMADERITDTSFRLWLAPESLATQTFDKGADLYMLANIMWEILVQDDPFFGVASATESNIKRGWHPNVDYIWEKLEDIEDEFFTQIQKMIGIMKSLWSRNPGIRPLPNQLRDKMAQVKRGIETVSSRNLLASQSSPRVITPSQQAAQQNASTGMVPLLGGKSTSPRAAGSTTAVPVISEDAETPAETMPPPSVSTGGGLPPRPGFQPITPASPTGLPPPPSGFGAPVARTSPAGAVATMLVQTPTHTTPPPNATVE